MRIALVSNFWHRRGGLETVMLQDAAGLAARGHTVVPFAAAHPLNEPSPYEWSFPRYVDHAALGSELPLAERIREAVRLLYNRSAVDGFDRLLEIVRPDVVHQHGISRQLSPSVIERAHQVGLATVLSLHDYSLRCPRAVLSRPGAPVCAETSCAGHRYDRAVRFKCVHGSRVASAVAAVELLVNRALKRFERSVDMFLVPSSYAAARMAEAGIPSRRLRVMPNAIEMLGSSPAPTGSGFVALGRLIDYKGFDVVIEAARRMPHASFTIAGEGPDRSRLEGLAAGLDNVRLIGRVGEKEATQLVRDSRAVLVPSIVPETFGMVVLEAWREARAVVVTRTGALPELVEDGVNGYVVQAGAVDEFVRAVSRLEASEETAQKIGQAGRECAGTRYAMGAHLDRLEALYSDLVR